MLNKGKNVEADCYRLCDTSTSLSTSSIGIKCRYRGAVVICRIEPANIFGSLEAGVTLQGVPLLLPHAKAGFRTGVSPRFPWLPVLLHWFKSRKRKPVRPRNRLTLIRHTLAFATKKELP